MPKKTHLGDVMETTCPHCRSHYRVTDNQLKAALGRVKCGECGMVFNALQSLKDFDGELPENFNSSPEPELEPEQEAQPPDIDIWTEPKPTESELSLHEAMYGHKRNSLAHFSPFLWFIGIVLLLVLGITQAIYYNRYQLVDKPRFQQQVLALCEIVPCAESQFSSIRQIKLLERNVFTHPVTSDALMVTGSFINQAPFSQKMPRMLVSLFDIKGELIANRVFEPSEYLQEDRNRTTIDTTKPEQFRLEIIDPGTDALTYEFEFF